MNKIVVLFFLVFIIYLIRIFSMPPRTSTLSSIYIYVTIRKYLLFYFFCLVLVVSLLFCLNIFFYYYYVEALMDSLMS